jgi:RHS repeat-associated protein
MTSRLTRVICAAVLLTAFFALTALPACASGIGVPRNNPSDYGGPPGCWQAGDDGGCSGGGIGGKPSGTVNTYTGNLTVSDMPVYYRSVGDAIPFVVYFNSQEPVSQNRRRPMNGLWSHSYLVYVACYSVGDGAWLAEGDGSNHYFFENDNGSFTAMVGVFDTLEKLSGDPNYLWKLTRSSGHKLYFDSSGTLKRIEDRSGLSWLLTYTNGLLTSIQGPAGRYTTLEYTTFTVPGRTLLTRVTVPGGLHADFAYDAFISGDYSTYNIGPTSITDAVGDPYDLDYGSSSDRDRIVGITDPSGQQTNYTYANDGGGNRIVTSRSITGLSDSTVTYDYNVDGVAKQLKVDITETKDGVDRITRHVYDRDTAQDGGYGKLLAIVQDYGGLGLSSNYAYYTGFQLARFRDSWQAETGGKAHRHFYYYDDTRPVNAGRVTKYVDPENSDANPTETGLPTANCPGYLLTYDGDGNLTQLKTPENRQIDLTYTSNRLTQVTVQDQNRAGSDYDHVTSFEYWDSSRGYQLKKITDGRGNATWVYYDSTYWYPDYVDLPLGDSNDLDITCNAYGDVTSIKDGNDNITSFQFDGIHRLTGITYPSVGNGQKTLAFDWQCCGLDSITDENGVVTDYVYEDEKSPSVPSHRLWKIIEDAGTGRLNYVTEYTYDEVDNVKTVKNARSKTTTYTYDDADRVTRVDYPDSTYETWTYRDDGRIITHRDLRNRTTTYRYDADDRLASPYASGYKAIDYPNNTDIYLTRDKDGLVTELRDASGTNTATFYPSGWLKDITFDTGGINKTLQYNYDQVGNTSSMTIPGGGSFSYVYNALNLLESVTNPNSVTNSFTYDYGGRLTRITRPGSYIDYQYNARNWVTAVLNRKTDNSTILDINYYYNDGSLWDNTGSPLKFTETYPGPQTYTWTLRYDAVGREIEETRTNPGQTQDYSLHYTYDAVGNRLTRLSDATTPNVTWTYTYDNNDKLTSVTDGTNTSNFYYNEPYPGGPVGGNITKVTNGLFGGVWTMAYDDENQPTSIIYPSGGGSVTDLFYYNAFGQRYRARLSGTYYRYLYDGDRLMEELNDSGGPLGRYTTTDGSFYGPWLHMQRNDGSSRFPLYNLTGTARRLVDATGTVTEAYSHDTFGQGGQVSGSPANQFRYGGAWGYMTDPSGLLQLGVRNYWPALGRFMQQDPAGEGTNWYTYAGSNPVSNADPSGMFYDYLLDIGFIGMDAWDLIRNPSWGKAGWLAADIGLGVAPFVPAAGGAAARGVKAVSHADDAVDAAKAGSRVCKTIHKHHLLPKQFRDFFRKRGLDIEKYKIPLPDVKHTKKPHGIHTGPDNWNRRWKDWIEQNPNAKKCDVLKFLKKLRKEFGI